MPFKIVETVENNEKELTIVPDKWEDGGILSWPREYADKLIYIPETVPQEGWFNMKCVVIKSFLADYEEAKRVLGVLRKKYEQYGVTIVNGVKDISQPLELVTIETRQHEQQTDEMSLPTHQTLFLQQNLFQAPTRKPVGTHPRSQLHAILENQKYILKNQSTILTQISKLNARLESMTRTRNRVASFRSTFSDNAPMTCIDSKDALDKFEQSLQDPVIKAEVKNKLLSLPWTRKGQGMNNAYLLIDVMFSREFLTKCSWTGGSRPGSSPNLSKICFRVYKRTFQCFFEVIHESDPNFTFMECEKFIRNMLRNSIKRNTSKRLRASTSKNRSKKVKRDVTPNFENKIDQ